MKVAICPLSIVPVRKEPGDRAEMVSQWLFGETADVLERTEKWTRLQFHHDGYTGWVDNKQVIECETPNFDPDLRVIEQAPILDLGDRQVMLPYGAVLPFHKDGHIQWEERRIEVQAVTNADKTGTRAELIDKFTHPFLGAPYFWGGRTPWGVDCSGFVQMVFILMGIYLQRDANQQAEEGDAIDLVDLAEPGDLAFFDNEEGRITHVGIMLSEGRIAHASGRVRIDRLDHQGIFNSLEKRYTHKLRMVRRIL